MRLTTRTADLDLSVLGAGGQHLRVPAEAHAQHGVVHHHEVVLSLVLQILGDTQSAGDILDHPGVPETPHLPICVVTFLIFPVVKFHTSMKPSTEPVTRY